MQSDTNPGVGGEALAAYVKGLWAAFPDFHLELLNTGEIEPGLVAHHWMVKGTDNGKGADGSEPTGRALAMKGASIIKVEGDKVVSDQCYFDRVALDSFSRRNSDRTRAGTGPKSIEFGCQASSPDLFGALVLRLGGLVM